MREVKRSQEELIILRQSFERCRKDNADAEQTIEQLSTRLRDADEQLKVINLCTSIGKRPTSIWLYTCRNRLESSAKSVLIDESTRQAYLSRAQRCKTAFKPRNVALLIQLRYFKKKTDFAYVSIRASAIRKRIPDLSFVTCGRKIRGLII